MSDTYFKISLSLLSFMVRQGSPERSRRAHHERNQYITVHPELVEGLKQRYQG
jgi:hypothetical protein